MLRSILTPLLKSAFDDPQSSSQPSNNVPESDDSTAEDFAYDVRVEIMRRTVEDVKVTHGSTSQRENLEQIFTVMQQDARMKDVFGELDGFIAVVNVLSTLRDAPISGEEWDHTMCIAFRVVILALDDHHRNNGIFESTIGFDALKEAIMPSMLTESFYRLCGLLLALALLDDALFGFFLSDANDSEALFVAKDLDGAIATRLGDNLHLGQPKSLIALFTLCRALSPPERTSYIIYKTIDRIAGAAHRHQALLNAAGLMTPIFDALYSPEGSHILGEDSRHLLRKTLRRLLDIGFPSASTARDVLARGLSETGVNSEVLSILKSGARSRWPSFLSIHRNGSLTFVDESNKVFPPPLGFSFLAWVFIDSLPSSPQASIMLWGARSASPSRWIARFNALPNGSLEYFTPLLHESFASPPNVIRTGRWTHVGVVHHASKSSSPSIRIFVDGREVAAGHSGYPKPSPPPTSHITGYDSFDEDLSDGDRSSRWSLASCHILALPLQPELVLLGHRLGAKVQTNFQDASLFRFLTYQMYTSINVHLFGWHGRPNASGQDRNDGLAVLSKGLTGNVGFDESQIILSLHPNNFMDDPNFEESSGVHVVRNTGTNVADTFARVEGDVICSRAQPLDLALWKAGGPAVTLEMIRLSTTTEDLITSLNLFLDTIKTSWQNSEDAERMQAYDVLVSQLRTKASLFSAECFHSLFTFLGIDLTSPEDAVIINPVAYRSIALDFHFWSLMPSSIQVLYWQHFRAILEASRFHKFNIKQRFAKRFSSPGVVRQLLFMLQTDLFAEDMVRQLVTALEVIAKSNWSSEASIKPILSYLAANLPNHAKSPFSVRSVAMSRIDRFHSHEKAALVFQTFVSILEDDASIAKFNAALPSARIAILLLGPSPTSSVASLTIRMIGLHLAAFGNFTRKLELASFWHILRQVLPPAWDSEVSDAAFDLLFGRFKVGVAGSTDDSVRCTPILPCIMSALEYGLGRMLDRGTYVGPDLLSHSEEATKTGSDMEALLEKLIQLQASSPTFRLAFRTKCLPNFITFSRSFLGRAIVVNEASTESVISRLTDKLSHLATMLSLDPSTSGIQIREVASIHQSYYGLQDLLQNSSAPRSPTSPKTALSQPDHLAQKTLLKIAGWRASIVAAEKQRRRKAYQDLREKLRAMRQLTHWESLVHHERGLWPSSSAPRWRLDETEGPYRIRKKLETEVEVVSDAPLDLETLPRDLTDAEDWVSVQQVTAPWDEAFDFSITEDQGWDDDLEEDRLRKIRHELEPGDVIEVVKNVSRIVGVDSSPGLLIWGQTHLYVRDGLVESSGGDILEAIDAPKDVLSVPGTLVIDPDPNVRARRWSLDSLASFSTRTYLFRDVGLEIYFKDSRSLLCVFGSKKERQPVIAKLQKILNKPSTSSTASASLLRTPLVSLIPTSAKSFFNQPGIDTAQRRWQAREISNFAYLQILNQASGRTPNDLTQYPIFPWILRDYSSDVLDLSDQSIFRDLSVPMGALTPSRREAAEARYNALTEIGEPPFHYGTHYSSSMITSHFLIRLEPFSRHFKSLQGGDFDLPERLFIDIKKAWDSASVDSRGDVRELIPEFFTCHEFLENLAGLELGTMAGGEKIGDVSLPPWAKGDPLLFIQLHRKALESEYVSRNLPAWIDLIWGSRQRDVDALNIFHPLSYEGAIDLDSIKDPLELAASVGIIHNFGQTPRKLFSSAHPPRYMDGELSLPLGSSYGVPEDAHLLLQSSRAAKVLSSGIVGDIYVDTANERIIPCPPRTLIVPGYAHEKIEWGFKDQSLRLFVDKRVVQVVESVQVTCAIFSDPSTLLTGGSDHIVHLWRIQRPSSSASASYAPSSTRLKLAHLLRGHSDRITCITASRSWSVIVSGSEDHSAIIWDLNRATYVRSLWFERGVVQCAIHENSGDIITCSVNQLSIHTLNGHHIASIRLPAAEQPIFSMSMHERETSLVPVLACGGANGVITLRTWNANDPSSVSASGGPIQKKTSNWRIKTLRQLKLRKEVADGRWTPGVTALEFVGEMLYSGDEAGRVHAWCLPE
ncbi:beach-domain-containing protein [Clavulina sp. PMI_390]|nr:beach-domain-containing protein [Clavulina sp. PMI_390]